MTRTEYAEYIGSEEWRRRRADYLSTSAYCERCGLSRRFSRWIYDQDLHVHHKSYARIGAEIDGDLATLCKRCHEIETHGQTDLPEWIVPRGSVGWLLMTLEDVFKFRVSDAFLREVFDVVASRLTESVATMALGDLVARSVVMPTVFEIYEAITRAESLERERVVETIAIAAVANKERDGAVS
jgi:hypothetical protein